MVCDLDIESLLVPYMGEEGSRTVGKDGAADVAWVWAISSCRQGFSCANTSSITGGGSGLAGVHPSGPALPGAVHADAQIEVVGRLPGGCLAGQLPQASS